MVVVAISEGADQGIAERIGERHDFGGHPALRTTDGGDHSVENWSSASRSNSRKCRPVASGSSPGNTWRVSVQDVMNLVLDPRTMASDLIAARGQPALATGPCVRVQISGRNPAANRFASIQACVPPRLAPDAASIGRRFLAAAESEIQQIAKRKKMCICLRSTTASTRGRNLQNAQRRTAASAATSGMSAGRAATKRAPESRFAAEIAA